MKENQGPTPAGTSRPYRNLPEALRAHRIDPVNHEFITAITDAIGISSYIDRGRYIEAIRRGPGAALHIGKTYTNGFTAEEPIYVGATPMRMLPSEGRPPYLYVSHPSELRPVAPTKKTAARKPAAPATPRAPKATPVEERDYGVCTDCFMVKNAAGKCGCF
ncbi:hypothetical protein [uncultured Microbacterium sp.]|uniref:hypothetical protein n=1 Tax=uncultured Microbacterium sp. TaxID=191216 RepID=UPI0026198ED2|nr:hypothetical protein [uncultured Microbacterium sp.]